MKKFWWGIFFAALISVLLLAPESNFSNRIRDFWYGSPEVAWPIAGLPVPFIFMVLTSVGYLRSESKRWQEFCIKAFVPLLTANLALYGAIILAAGGWTK